MNEEITRGLKITFLVHAVIAGVVGVQHLLAPRLWTDLAGMAITETVTWRALGAALIGFAVSSGLAYRQARWAAVRIVVIMEIVWSVLGALVLVWGIMAEGLPPLEWLNAGLLALFGLAFAVFLARHERETVDSGQWTVDSEQ